MRRLITKEARINESIKVKEVRLISSDGKQLGVVEIDKALKRAENQELDLVEVAPTAKPPVCRIMDYSKYKYEQSKRAKEARKKQKTVDVKEIKFKPKIEEHDYQIKLNHIRKFLKNKDKVKVNLRFRGREVTHPEIGREILERVITDTKDMAEVTKEPNLQGKTMIMYLEPR